MQEFIPFNGKILPKLMLFILLIPPLSIGWLSYRPLKIYKCIRVLDGDTVELQGPSNKFRVRMSFIDAPESLQRSFDKVAIGLESTAYLKLRVEGKFVGFKLEGEDMYRRKLGVIYLGNKNINLEMVHSGFAVAYQRVSSFKYRQAQYIARSRRSGIWQYEGFLSPWIFRQLK